MGPLKPVEKCKMEKALFLPFFVFCHSDINCAASQLRRNNYCWNHSVREDKKKQKNTQAHRSVSTSTHCPRFGVLHGRTQRFAVIFPPRPLSLRGSDRFEKGVGGVIFCFRWCRWSCRGIQVSEVVGVNSRKERLLSTTVRLCCVPRWYSLLFQSSVRG